MPAQKPTDVFMQFATMEGIWPPDTTVITEAQLKTGLSVRGGLMWIIHLIEIASEMGAIAAGYIEIALSTVAGLTAVPTLGDKGCIIAERIDYVITTSGGGHTIYPQVYHYLPPVPLAAPNVSLYFRSSSNDVTLDPTHVIARLGYTTSPLDAKSYAEIAETWSYV